MEYAIYSKLGRKYCELCVTYLRVNLNNTLDVTAPHQSLDEAGKQSIRTTCDAVRSVRDRYDTRTEGKGRSLLISYDTLSDSVAVKNEMICSTFSTNFFEDIYIIMNKPTVHV